MVFVFPNVLNFLDRQLPSAVAPTLKTDFHLSDADYGAIMSAFSLTYAVMAPFAGALLDPPEFGVHRGRGDGRFRLVRRGGLRTQSAYAQPGASPDEAGRHNESRVVQRVRIVEFGASSDIKFGDPVEDRQ